MVFWKDFFDKGLKDPLKTLMAIRRTYAGGKTRTLYADDDMFIAERTGTPAVGDSKGTSGLILVTNNNGADWKGAWVTVRPEWAGKTLVDRTGNAGIGSRPVVAADGRVQLWAPPGGYAVFVPEDAGAPLPAKKLAPRPRGTGEATRTDGNEVFRVTGDDGLPLPRTRTMLSSANAGTTVDAATLARIKARDASADTATTSTIGIDGVLEERTREAAHPADAAER